MGQSGINTDATLLGRISGFLEAVDPSIVMLGVLGLMFVFGLALFGRRMELVALLLTACTFSGSVIAALHSGSTLLRWLAIGLIAMNVVRVRKAPGPLLLTFIGYVVIGLSMTVFSRSFTWSIQWGGMLLVLCVAGVAVADYVRDRLTAERLCATYLVAGVVFAIVSVIAGRELLSGGGGQRFAGGQGAAGNFVMTAGLILPFSVWGAMRHWPHRQKLLRVGCACLAIVIFGLIAVAGQRAGAIAGIAGTLPLLATKRFKTVLAVSLGLFVVGLFIYQLASINSKHTEFLAKRFSETDSSNRTTIWAKALHEITKNPVLGQGFGSNRILQEKIRNSMHNMYLSVWYDTGFFGLMCFMGALAFGTLRAFFGIFKAPDFESRQLARLVFGALILVQIQGLVTTSVSSVSDIATCTAVFMLVIADRLPEIFRAAATEPANARKSAPQMAMPRAQYAYQTAPVIYYRAPGRRSS